MKIHHIWYFIGFVNLIIAIANSVFKLGADSNDVLSGAMLCFGFGTLMWLGFCNKSNRSK